MKYDAKSTDKTLKVFEAFAGIGAQAAALKRLNINYEIVGISEWYVNAIICYDALHTADQTVNVPSYKEQVEYLRSMPPSSSISWS